MNGLCYFQAIDLQKQLKYFEEVQKSLTEKLGDVQARELISEAVYFISIGSNDYMGGYLGNPKTQELFPPEQYISMVIGNLTQAIQVSLFLSWLNIPIRNVLCLQVMSL